MYIYAATASCFSAIGSFFVIFVHIRYDLQSKSDISILVLQILDLLTSVITMIPAVKFSSTKYLCDIQAFLVQTVTLSEVLWTGYIAIIMYEKVHRKIENRYTIPNVLILIVLFSLLTAAIPLFFSAYDPSGPWCWIKSDSLTNNLLSFFTFYFICWCVIAFCFYMYRKVIMISNRLVGDCEIERDYVVRLRLYPFIMVFAFIPVTVLRILQWANKEYDVLLACACVVARLLGFYNALVYGFTPRIRELLKGNREPLFRNNLQLK